MSFANVNARMTLRTWVGHRLDVVCLLLHACEFAVSCAVVGLWRRYVVVSWSVQILAFLAQMAWARLCVISYFYWHSSRTMRSAPRCFQLPPHQEAMVVLQESLLGAWALYSVCHPFSKFLTRSFEVPRLSHKSPVKYPVLFIHGYACNAGYWYPVLRFLSSADVHHLYTISLEPLYLDIPSFAHQVAKKVDWILNETKSEKVILVGHSMGGLVARAYTKWHGGKNCVAKMITLQTPHQGTDVAKSYLARFLSGRSVNDMLPGSPFLTKLGSPEESNDGGSIPMTSVFSYHDTLISPQESSILKAPNTRNIPFAGLGHLVLPFVPRIQKLILQELLSCT